MLPSKTINFRPKNRAAAAGNGSPAGLMTLSLAEENAVEMKTPKIDPNERHGAHFRFTIEQYEYIARLAAMTPRGTNQKIITDRVFPRRWKDELEEMRAAQRKLGFKDFRFYPLAVLNRMGIEVKPGRRRREKLRVAA
jgi:hypothetical protein